MGTEECICPQAGFCELYRQEMTYDPPNWQWCQNASPERREWYRKQCVKKHDRKKRILKGKFVSNNQLLEDCKNYLIPKIGGLNLKGIAAVPRSGFLPASFCSVMLNLPLYSISSDGTPILLSGLCEYGGKRMEKHKDIDGKILILDDTVYSGNSILPIKKSIDRDKFLFGTLYVHPASKDLVDIYGKELAPPHLLEWNFFNSTYIEKCLIDFDGILCPNVPYEACQSEDKYIEYITNVTPIYHRIPRTYVCKGIVTARLEKYRDITEKWLEKHKIKYGFLKMFPTEREEERNSNHVAEAAAFKLSVLNELHGHFFVESEASEAQLMREGCSQNLIICPDEGKFA